jgi:signal peptidase II
VKLSSIRPSRRVLLTAAVGAVVVLADTFSKRAVQDGLAIGERRSVVDDLVVLTHIQNTGAAYGMFAGHRWLLVLTAAIIAAATPMLLRALPASGRWRWTGPTFTGMIIGGAAGNLAERARHGYVTDFIQTPPIKPFQVFNLADASIFVSIVALLVLSFVVGDEAPRRAPVAVETPLAPDVADEATAGAVATAGSDDNDTTDEPRSEPDTTADTTAHAAHDGREDGQPLVEPDASSHTTAIEPVADAGDATVGATDIDETSADAGPVTPPSRAGENA